MGTVEDLSARLRAVEAKAPEQRARLAAAIASEATGLGVNIDQLLNIIGALTQEYVRLTGAVCNDVRVPKDLRDELAEHVAIILTDLQAAIEAT